MKPGEKVPHWAFKHFFLYPQLEDKEKLDVKLFLPEMWYIYTMEYYSVLKKEWYNAICSNMDRARDYHTKWSKSERQIPYDYHFYVESKIWYNRIYLWNRNKLIDIENRLWLPRGRELEEGWIGSLGVADIGIIHSNNKQHLLFEWINNKVLLYSTGNFIQYPLINHNGKEYLKRMYVYTCITDSLYCTAEINKTL